jgi:hypothetical protein
MARGEFGAADVTAFASGPLSCALAVLSAPGVNTALTISAKRNLDFIIPH